MATILSIDDSALQRGWITDILKDLGHDVLEAVDGLDGLKVIEATPPDCIFLDLLMPNMDGISFLKEYQKKDWEMPVIVLTADI